MDKELELIDAVLRGETESFEPLLRPYRRSMLAIAYRMTGDMEQAREVCQEAILKVYKYLASFNPSRSFKSWLYKLTVNATYDLLRRERKQRQIFENQTKIFQNTGPNPEKALLSHEIGSKIKEFLTRLTPKERAVFLLRDGEGMNIKETAAALRCSSISVRTHLSRARSKLREELSKVYGPDERR